MRNKNKITVNDTDMFNHLENFGMLDNIMLDSAIFKANYQLLFSPNALWQRFIRSN